MHRFRRSAKWVSILMVALLSVIYMPLHAVFASMVETQVLLGDQDNQLAREKVRSFLNRREVKAVLTAQGIDPFEARSRVASLSDAEVQEIAGRIDELPAGGNLLGTVIVITLIFFLVLLILDMLGITDVFPFINPARK